MWDKQARLQKVDVATGRVVGQTAGRKTVPCASRCPAWTITGVDATNGNGAPSVRSNVSSQVTGVGEVVVISNRRR